MGVWLWYDKALWVLAVYDGDRFSSHLHRLMRDANDPLYKVFFWIEWVAEHDDITSLWIIETIGDLIDDEILTISKGRVHRSTIYYKWLGDEGADRDDDDKSGDDITESFSEKVFL